jgi:hypothetical protein
MGITDACMNTKVLIGYGYEDKNYHPYKYKDMYGK